jgi:DNA modification methylase
VSPPADVAAVLAGEKRWAVVCARWQDVLPLLHDRCIDVCITDPPYSKEVHSRSIRRTYLPDTKDQPCRRMRKFEFGFDPITPEEQRLFAAEAKRLVKRWTLVFSDTETAHSWRTELTGAGLDFVRYGFWVKDRAMPQITGDRPGSRVEQITIVHPKGRKRWNGGGLGNVWQHPVVANCSGHRSDRVHEAQKPETLLVELTELFTEPNDIELDCYGGSGTHGAMALRLGRRCILIEKNEKHAEMCRDRLAAEEAGSTWQARRAGQIAMFGK